MLSLVHLHIVAFLTILLSVFIFNKNISNNIGSKYFLINYIYHNHKYIGSFLITYPFLIIFIYFLFENIIPVGSLFISVLYAYFMYELISKKNIDRKEEYIYWYKNNVKHSLSMHAHDMIKKDFNFLSEKRSIITLFKFEVIFFVSLIIESEVMNEVLIHTAIK